LSFFCSVLEIEAKEACDWLRATGFPQYAQLYEGKPASPIFFLIGIIIIFGSQLLLKYELFSNISLLKYFIEKQCFKCLRHPPTAQKKS
jgi:hypothetical protein